MQVLLIQTYGLVSGHDWYHSQSLKASGLGAITTESGTEAIRILMGHLKSGSPFTTLLLLSRLDYSSIKEQDIEEEGDEFVGVPKNMKKIVTGRRRQVLEQIEQKSAANINSMRRDDEGYIIVGYERQRARARRLIKEKVVR